MTISKTYLYCSKIAMKCLKYSNAYLRSGHVQLLMLFFSRTSNKLTFIIMQLHSKKMIDLNC